MSKIIRTRSPAFCHFMQWPLVFLGIVARYCRVNKLWAACCAALGRCICGHLARTEGLARPGGGATKCLSTPVWADVDAMLTDLPQKTGEPCSPSTSSCPDPQLSAAMTAWKRRALQCGSVEAKSEKAKQVRSLQTITCRCGERSAGIMQAGQSRACAVEKKCRSQPLPRRAQCGFHCHGVENHWKPCTPPRAWTVLQISRCCRTCFKGQGLS